MITFKNKKGDFSKTLVFLTKSLNFTKEKDITPIAKQCVEELKEATPKDSGLTAESWDYEIKRIANVTSLTFYNKNIQNGVNVALLLEYGHGTNNGGWVEGYNYIDPIIREKYNEILNKTWKEITRL